MLHTEVMEQIWKKFGRAPVDLFASRETSQCRLWFSLTHPAPLGLDAMVQMWLVLHLTPSPKLLCVTQFVDREEGGGNWQTFKHFNNKITRQGLVSMLAWAVSFPKRHQHSLSSEGERPRLRMQPWFPEERDDASHA